MTDPTTIENAIHAWISAGSGLSPKQVIWAGQGGPAPSGPYISLRLTDLGQVGQDWIDVEPAADPEPGAEVEYKLRGVRTRTLTIQVFGGSPLGSSSNAAVLSRALTARALPSIESALRAGGVGIGPIGAITVIDRTRSGLFEARAVVDVTIHLVSELSETGTTIESVETTNETA